MPTCCTAQVGRIGPIPDSCYAKEFAGTSAFPLILAPKRSCVESENCVVHIFDPYQPAVVTVRLQWAQVMLAFLPPSAETLDLQVERVVVTFGVNALPLLRPGPFKSSRSRGVSARRLFAV